MRKRQKLWKKLKSTWVWIEKHSIKFIHTVEKGWFHEIYVTNHEQNSVSKGHKEERFAYNVLFFLDQDHSFIDSCVVSSCYKIFPYDIELCNEKCTLKYCFWRVPIMSKIQFRLQHSNFSLLRFAAPCFPFSDRIHYLAENKFE